MSWPRAGFVDSPFTGLVVGPGERGAQHVHDPLAVTVPTARSQHLSRGAHTPHPTVLMCQGGKSTGRTCLASPTAAQPLPGAPRVLSVLWKVLKSLIKAVTLRMTPEAQGMEEMAQQLVFLPCTSPLPVFPASLLRYPHTHPVV